MPPFPIHLSYHWNASDTGLCTEFDGVRTPIAGALEPSEEAMLEMRVRAPLEPGRYRLRATLVQERVMWFDQLGPGFFADCDVEVRDSG